MTARRRRKSGSGPAATALIAWVGGAQSQRVASGTAGTGVHAWSPIRLPGGRAILVGRAFGLAAGTVLACGSVLASVVHVGDGSLAGEGASPLPSYTPAVPDAGSGSSDGYGGAVSPAHVPATAPVAVRAQTFARTSPTPRLRAERVHRNSPAFVDAPVEHDPPSHTAQPPWRSPAPPADDAPSTPIAPVDPVLNPPASPVGRVPEVGGVLEPATRRTERSALSSIQAARPVTAVVPLAEEATQPAMATLGALLPKV
jgi:hypothetical protein